MVCLVCLSVCLTCIPHTHPLNLNSPTNTLNTQPTTHYTHHIYTGTETYLGKTASLLSSKEKSSNIQKFLIRIVLILTSLAVVVVIIALIYLLLVENVSLRDSLVREFTETYVLQGLEMLCLY